jgi:hypothetical protein
MVIVHSFIALAFLWEDEKRNTSDNLPFFVNMLFLVVIASFLTSIFGIWKIISGDIVGDLYKVYFIFLFASLHVSILAKAFNKEKYIDFIVYLNYVFIALVVLILMPIVFIEDPYQVLGEIYFRILAAAAIIDGTLGVLIIIFHRLYMHNHPKETNPLANTYTKDSGKVVEGKGLSIWVWILIIYLAFQVLIPFLAFGAFGIFRLFR